jgi:UDP-hydrolysing UDP-N-acetyl-D-glucosamine 2-epimerase
LSSAHSGRRRVAVVTGTRADYGLLRPTIEALHRDDRFEVGLLVCAMHLSEQFGRTVSIIEDDGFPIAARIPTEADDDAPGAMGRRIAAATAGFAQALGDVRPELIVLLGDRYEMLAAALAATGHGIPVAHLHGGELSEGSLDDAMRHAITKLSHLHFVATRLYGERVCQLGEQPDRVFVVGAAGLEAIRELAPLSREELAASLDVPGLRDPLVVATYHPTSLDPGGAEREASEVADAIGQVVAEAGSAVVTLPNDDPGNRPVRERMLELARSRPNVHAFTSLGQLRYLSLLSHADLMVGNSSSGVLEAPAFLLPVVNVGERQQGRLMTRSVLQAPPERAAIVAAARRALDPGFRSGLQDMDNPYGSGDVSRRVIEVLAGIDDLAGLRHKRFFDVPDGPWRADLRFGESGT